jgi:hypothetical protein
VASASKKPPAPITKVMRDGKEPLRTFGDLKQFFDKRSEADEPATGDTSPPAGS